MPSAVIFDFGNVICHFDNTLFLQRLTPYTDKSYDELGSLIYHSSDLVYRYETGVMTSDEFIDTIRKTCALSISKGEFVKAFTGIFNENKQIFNLVRSLKSKYKLGLLSNTNELDYHNAIMKCPVFPLFDAVTTSFEVGALKPSNEIYEDSLRKLHLPAQECIYVDDIPSYVEAANGLGMKGVRYASYDQLVSSLASLGVHAQLKASPQ